MLKALIREIQEVKLFNSNFIIQTVLLRMKIIVKSSRENEKYIDNLDTVLNGFEKEKERNFDAVIFKVKENGK